MNPRMVLYSPLSLRILRSAAFAAALAVLLAVPSGGQDSAKPLELTRTIRTWEFLPVVGTRAALFGTENGHFEAWVYPLKLFRNLHLTFHVGDRALPADTLARTLTVRPESASILFVGDSFRVRETLCVPVGEPGAVILLEVETEQPLEIEAAFTPDFQLEWPAAVGGTYSTWDAKERAFFLGEEARKYAAYVGSPTAQDPHAAYQTNYSASDEDSMRLGVTQKGKETKVLVFAASVTGPVDAAKAYEHILGSYSDLQHQSADFYRAYLDNTIGLELPDPALEQAYDWARISTVQGVVNNPFLGTGLVAGYRTSGTGQRPGFAWFFGRDSEWTSFALNAEGDFETSRAALDFIAKNDYATKSGDTAFARGKWDNLWRAYQFLRSTYDSNGLAQNLHIGHGWVEGGPLLPVKNEYYQAGLGVEALRALSNLARLVGKQDVSQQLATEFEKSRAVLEREFWSPEAKIYAFALNQGNQRVDEPTVLTAVPMWFGLADASHANETIARLAAILDERRPTRRKSP